jgi:hypothetical protein
VGGEPVLFETILVLVAAKAVFAGLNKASEKIIDKYGSEPTNINDLYVMNQKNLKMRVTPEQLKDIAKGQLSVEDAIDSMLRAKRAKT